MHSARAPSASVIGSDIERAISSARSTRSVGAHAVDRAGPSVALSSSNQRPHAGTGRHSADEEQVVEFVGVTGPGPQLVEHLGHRPGSSGPSSERRRETPAARTAQRPEARGRRPHACARS